MAPPRRLTEADVELWLKVVQTVMPRPGANVPARAAPLAQPASRAKPGPEPSRRATAPSYTPPMSVPKAPPLAAFERRLKKKVAAGRVGIDDKLDLHGMTQMQAHDALLRFLLRAQGKDARLVLVVTGKGHSNPAQAERGVEPGVLRRSVPIWLRDKLLRAVVLGFEEASRQHGGEGALYIRLRRRDPNG